MNVILQKYSKMRKEKLKDVIAATRVGYSRPLLILFLGRREHATFVPDINEAARATLTGQLGHMLLCAPAKILTLETHAKTLRIKLREHFKYKWHNF